MLLRDALKEIRTSTSGVDLEVIKADTKRKTAGELMFLSRCTESGANHNEHDHQTITVSSPDKPHPIPLHISLIMKINGEFIN